MQAAVRNLDPAFSNTYDELHMLIGLYNNIVQVGPGFEIQPGLAKSWDFSADGKTITFDLNQGVKFQDGTELDAQAVKWNIDRIMDPDIGSGQRGLLAAVSLVEVTDKYTVIFKLSKPFRPILGSLTDQAGMIVSPTAAQKFGATREGELGSNPVGTGAFKLGRWFPDQEVVLERNDNYWEEGLPYLDKVTLQGVSADIKFAMLRTGETDMTEIRPDDFATAEREPTIVVHQIMSGLYNAIMFNTELVPWDKLSMRQAVAYAMDRETILQVGFNGAGVVGCHQEGVGWSADREYCPYPFNLEKAKAKVAESGFPEGYKDNRDLWCRDTQIVLCEIYQAMLTEAGIDLEINLITRADWFARRANGELGVILAGWGPKADPDVRWRIIWKCDGWANYQRYCDPETDELIERAAATYDTAKAKELYKKIIKRTADSAAIAYNVWNLNFFAVTSRVHNYVLQEDRIPRLRKIWLEQ